MRGWMTSLVVAVAVSGCGTVADILAGSCRGGMRCVHSGPRRDRLPTHDGTLAHTDAFVPYLVDGDGRVCAFEHRMATPTFTWRDVPQGCS